MDCSLRCADRPDRLCLGRRHCAGTPPKDKTLREGNVPLPDERIYVDGSGTPQIIGTATETFFQGGWYFQETAFSLPLHGAPVLTLLEGEVAGKMDATMYRFHVTDLVPFYDSIRFGIMQERDLDSVPLLDLPL
jgi:Protein of unknown function (DUF2961)